MAEAQANKALRLSGAGVPKEVSDLIARGLNGNGEATVTSLGVARR